MSDLSQPIILQLAQAVNTAYTAYDKLDWWHNDEAGAKKLIKELQPGYTNIAPIFVWESNPDDPQYPTLDGTLKPIVRPTPAAQSVLEEPPEGFVGSWPGSQLFGFAATIIESGINILILRGTVTNYEAGASLWNWDDMSPLAIPTPNGVPNRSANVKSGFWDFYQGDLARDIKSAIQSVNSHSAGPWYASAHSLGGAMLCLGVVDALSDQTFSTPPVVVTFGSVVVGDSGWAKVYDLQVPTSIRIANLSDFVPSLRSLLPGPNTTIYQHVGNTWAFVWQTDSDWDNHSMLNVYQAIVSSLGAFDLIYKEPDPNMELTYPVAIIPGKVVVKEK